MCIRCGAAMQQGAMSVPLSERIVKQNGILGTDDFITSAWSSLPPLHAAVQHMGVSNSHLQDFHIGTQGWNNDINLKYSAGPHTRIETLELVSILLRKYLGTVPPCRRQSPMHSPVRRPAPLSRSGATLPYRTPGPANGGSEICHYCH